MFSEPSVSSTRVGRATVRGSGFPMAVPDFFHVVISGKHSQPTHPAPKPRKVVLLHGWSQSHDSWIQTACRLRDRYGHDVLLLDFFGFGRSPWKGAHEDLTPKTLVRQVRDAIVHLGWEAETLTFGGVSMGASVSLLYAEAYPQQSIDRFVFIAPSGKTERLLNLARLSGYFARGFTGLGSLLKRAGLGGLVGLPPVFKLLCALNLIKNTPHYTVKQDLAYLGGARLTVLLGAWDMLHTAQDTAWRRGGGPRDVRVQPRRTHAMMCYNPDAWRLDLIPEAWHPVASQQDAEILAEPATAAVRPAQLSVAWDEVTGITLELLRPAVGGAKARIRGARQGLPLSKL